MLVLCLLHVLWPEVEAMGADVVRDGFRNKSCEVFTGACAPVVEHEGRNWIRAAEVFAHFPIAFVEAA